MNKNALKDYPMNEAQQKEGLTREQIERLRELLAENGEAVALVEIDALCDMALAALQEPKRETSMNAWIECRDYLFSLNNDHADTLGERLDKVIRAGQEPKEGVTVPESVTPEYLLSVLERTLIPKDQAKRSAMMSLIHALEQPDNLTGIPTEKVEKKAMPSAHQGREDGKA